MISHETGELLDKMLDESDICLQKSSLLLTNILFKNGPYDLLDEGDN